MMRSLIILIACLSLTSCVAQAAAPTVPPTSTSTATTPPTATLEPTETPTAAPESTATATAAPTPTVPPAPEPTIPVDTPTPVVIHVVVTATPTPTVTPTPTITPTPTPTPRPDEVREFSGRGPLLSDRFWLIPGRILRVRFETGAAAPASLHLVYDNGCYVNVATAPARYVGWALYYIPPTGACGGRIVPHNPVRLQVSIPSTVTWSVRFDQAFPPDAVHNGYEATGSGPGFGPPVFVDNKDYVEFEWSATSDVRLTWMALYNGRDGQSWEMFDYQGIDAGLSSAASDMPGHVYMPIVSAAQGVTWKVRVD